MPIKEWVWRSPPAVGMDERILIGVLVTAMKGLVLKF